MSVVLLVGAGLFVRSLGELRGLDLGFDLDRVATASLEFDVAELDDDERHALYVDAARALERLPSVASATVSAFPFGWAFGRSVSVPGLDSLPRLPGGGPYFFPVQPGYFETVGLQVLRGRGIEATDVGDGPGVVVVGETMARTLWPDGDALGRCLNLEETPLGCTEVVGVVQDAAINGYRERPSMVYYEPLEPAAMTVGNLYVRAQGDRDEMISEITPVLRQISPRVRFAVVRSFDDVLGPQARSWQLGATMFSVFGALALALAAIGLYSVLAFDVAQRTRELGIRAALGARKETLIGSVVLSGGRLVVFGIALGLLVALVAAPHAGALLFRVSPRDPLVLTAVAGVLLAVGAMASVVPALRATRVDPIDSLRAE
jgi:predicted permease